MDRRNVADRNKEQKDKYIKEERNAPDSYRGLNQPLYLLLSLRVSS